jgi:hypothetical protein
MTYCALLRRFPLPLGGRTIMKGTRLGDLSHELAGTVATNDRGGR